jgi:hypothetical protein
MWQTHVLGPLTDRRIEKYILAGYYGKEARDRRLAARKDKKRILRQRLLDELTEV